MEFKFKHRFPMIVCKDGTTLSLQAGKSLYCEPREEEGPYTKIEVGFPSVEPPDTWLEYADEGKIPSSVYGYIPIQLVDDYINSHGGVDWGKTLDTRIFHTLPE